jgi:hypothetical protein
MKGTDKGNRGGEWKEQGKIKLTRDRKIVDRRREIEYIR